VTSGVREPTWQLHDDGGDQWFGFAGVRALLREPDILLVPLPGHTPGQSGIAVRAGARWLLHAGDAYFFHGQLDTPPRMPLVLGIFQRRVDADRAQRVANQERLRQLKAEHGREVVVFNAHDAVDFDRVAGASA